MIWAWLRGNAPGFADLPEADRNAIRDFLFLWSLFEAKALGTNANGAAIRAAAERWRDQAPMASEGMARAMAYFTQRYCAQGAVKDLFEGLNFRAGRDRDLVLTVLSGESLEPVDQTTAVLLIICSHPA